jgi:hypothetical protein
MESTTREETLNEHKIPGYTVRLGTFVGERPTLNAQHPTPNS